MRRSLLGCEVLVFAGVTVVLAFLKLDCGEQIAKIGLTPFVVLPQIGNQSWEQRTGAKAAMKTKKSSELAFAALWRELPQSTLPIELLTDRVEAYARGLGGDTGRTGQGEAHHVVLRAAEPFHACRSAHRQGGGIELGRGRATSASGGECVAALRTRRQHEIDDAGVG